MSLIKSNRIIFVLVLTGALYIIAICYNVAYGFLKEMDIIWIDFSGKEGNYFLLFCFSVIVAPLFETFLNQFLPFSLLNRVKYFNERSYLILLTSAIFFGLCHFNSFFSMIYAFFMGLVLMYGYMIRIRTDKQTFYLIAISHSLVNLGIFIHNLS